MNHACHSGPKLFQPGMNRLPVSEGCVRATSNNNNNPPAPSIYHHHYQPPTHAWPAGMLQRGLDRIIKRIPPSDWHNLRVSLFLATHSCTTNHWGKPNCERRRTLEKKKKKEGKGRVSVAVLNPHTAYRALSRGQRSGKLNGTCLLGR